MQAVIEAFAGLRPDPADPAQAVSFGTSEHRGRSEAGSFNRDHILAITQAVVEYRRRSDITGPLFLGRDSHALSRPAWETALAVLVANGVEVRIERDSSLTATPLVSHAILRHNHGREGELADGLIIIPSHNQPEDGGIKYNLPHGGPADTEATGWIEDRANVLLAEDPASVKWVSLEKALAQAVHHDMLGDYVEALGEAIDIPAIAASDPVRQLLATAPGNQAPIGGVKVTTANGWFAAHPSGTESLCKLYAESFRGDEHMGEMIEDASSFLNELLDAA